MIDAKELRIRNKVHSPYHSLLFATVDGLLPNNNLVILKEVSTYDTFDNIVPIPLNPELLEACGFIEGRSDYSNECIVYINTIRLFQHEDNLYSLYAYNDHKVYISYLHELQNLFYYLTNTELEVNLNKEKV